VHQTTFQIAYSRLRCRLRGLCHHGDDIHAKACAKTREAFEKVAHEIGFEFKGDNWFKPALWNRPPGPNELGTAVLLYNGGYLRNVATGSTAGLEASLFDHTYQSSGSAHSGSSSTTRTMVAFPKFEPALL
jgi:hypothetical protein